MKDIKTELINLIETIDEQEALNYLFIIVKSVAEDIISSPCKTP